MADRPHHPNSAPPGAAILSFGHTWGLYAVGVGMMASFLFIVSGAWLLLVGVESQARRLIR